MHHTWVAMENTLQISPPPHTTANHCRAEAVAGWLYVAHECWQSLFRCLILVQVWLVGCLYVTCCRCCWRWWKTRFLKCRGMYVQCTSIIRGHLVHCTYIVRSVHMTSSMSFEVHQKYNARARVHCSTLYPFDVKWTSSVDVNLTTKYSIWLGKIRSLYAQSTLRPHGLSNFVVSCI